MRNIKLGRLFNAVFIHDAIYHMTTKQNLQKAIGTAFIHYKPGGVTLFCSDYVCGNFRSLTKHSGHNGDGRGMRYLEWNRDSNPNDNTYITNFAFLLREGDNVPCKQDRFIMDLFTQEDWLSLITEAGFKVRSVPFRLRNMELDSEDFLGIKSD